MNTREEPTTRSLTARWPCLVEGCSCKDARVLSFRRAAFHAMRARANGETADRVIAVEHGWHVES